MIPRVALSSFTGPSIGFLLTLIPCVACAADPVGSDSALFNALPARNIGPANMGGRIVDLDVVESNPKIVYVAAASGGLWKTLDGGDSWTPVFDEQATLCLGDVTVCQSNPDIVWVGTGEANPRNSVSWGNGVYKSTDGGKTWKCMGLQETHHIGRIVLHPKNPDIAWVAALGHLWGPNRARGLYKTTDGGETWTQSHYIDENTGFIDVAVDPEEPDILYAAAWAVRRDAYSGGNPRVQCGPGAGLYRTANGGKTWQRMTRGLPQREYGRCGLAVWRKDPKVVYAVVQTDRTSVTTSGQPAGNKLNTDAGGIFRSDDKGQTWQKLNDLVPRPFYYGQIRIDPTDDQRIYVLGVQFHVSDNGGKTFPARRTSVHPDHHALWIDPSDPKRVLLGNDGGLYFSQDRAATWEAIRNLPIAQFYGVGVDMRKPFRVVGGLQDNGTWGGRSSTDSTEGVTTAFWKRLGGADGFQAMIDPTEPATIYYESQYGGFQRLDLYSGRARSIRPRPQRGDPAYRFNWNSPMLMSPHDPATIYYGGNHLFRSTNRGDVWERISPDLTRGTPGPNSYSGHTLTTLAESPGKAGLLYVGTDDGKLWVTLDGGATWIDRSESVPGVPQSRWITRVECSHFAEGTAYLALNRYRNDDRKPYLFRTTDHGKTWISLVSNLPEGAPVHVIRESSRNPNLLFAGTEFGLFGSCDGGKTWQRMTRGLPPSVTVHDLVIHPRDRDLVIGTHGRSVYVLEIGPLEEMTPEVRAAGVHLFEPEPATAWQLKQPEQATPPRQYRAPNPPYGAAIWYHLKEPVRGSVTVTIKDWAGRTLATLEAAKAAGLHQVVWNLRRGEKELVGPGEYRVVLEAEGRQLSSLLRVQAP